MIVQERLFPVSEPSKRNLRSQLLDFSGDQQFEGHVGNKSFLLRRVQNLLNHNPQVLADFTYEAVAHPEDIVMAVIAGKSLVLASIEQEVWALQPELSCTSDAIADLFSSVRGAYYPSYTYDVVRSQNALLDRVVAFSKQRGRRRVFYYDYGTMNPADYIALGAQGLLYNETCRVLLPNLKVRS